MKYLKNIINNIKWFVCNDINAYCTTSTYNSNAYGKIIRNIENDLLDVQKVLPNIVNIVKDLQISNGVINENYQTLLNKSIDNKNTINDINTKYDDMSYEVEDKMGYDSVIDCVREYGISQDSLDDINDEIKALKDNKEMMLKNDNYAIINQELVNNVIDELIKRLS